MYISVTSGRADPAGFKPATLTLAQTLSTETRHHIQVINSLTNDQTAADYSL